MADIFTKDKRSWVMSRIRSQETKPEIILLDIVRKNFLKKGLRYRKNYRKVLGKPDISFTRQKVAVFLDGDFWHGYKYKDWIEKKPRKYWQGKIKRNIKRDKIINRTLREQGWKVLRFWEHEIKKNPEKAIEKIKNSLTD